MFLARKVLSMSLVFSPLWRRRRRRSKEQEHGTKE